MTPDTFITDAELIIDVRSPSEFQKGHIPGAHNLPLFSNDERAIVGTTYKKSGRQDAIKTALEFVGPKMRELIEVVENHDVSRVSLHCWRGGMRSASVAWLYELYGFEVDVLTGGYKAFRNWAITQFAVKRDLIILGGRTGAGKTKLLAEIAAEGHQMVDLEALASHRGSAFGSLGLETQPTQQQFENNLAFALSKLKPTTVWVEDESNNIGIVRMPAAFSIQVRTGQVVAIDVSIEDRVAHLTDIYGDEPVEDLIKSFQKIGKRLGPDRLKFALESLEKNDLASATRVALEYYDKAYDYGLKKREPSTIHPLSLPLADGTPSAAALVEFAANHLEFS